MNMKRVIPFLPAAAAISGAAGARAEHITWLIGLVNLAGYQAALLEMTNSPPDAAFAMDTHKWVVEGQSLDDLNLQDNHRHIEIVQIDFTNGIVRAKEKGGETLYTPRETNFMEVAAGKCLWLDHASFDDALDLYAITKDRTLLVHPEVNRLSFSKLADVRSKLETARLMETALQEKGAVTVMDGNRFAWIVPARLTHAISAGAPPPASHPLGQPSTNSVDTLPGGSINFVDTPLPDVLSVYQTLNGRKWVQNQPLPSAPAFTFHNQTPLTKNETLHAFDVLLGWHGLKVVNLDDNSYKLVPVSS